MIEQPFSVHFFQYQVTGAVDREQIIDKDSDLNLMFKNSVLEWGEGCERSTIANAVYAFTGTPNHDPVESQRMTEMMTKVLISAYLERNTPVIDKDKAIDIDLGDLIEQFEIDCDDLIQTFNIFVMKPNQVLSYEMNDIESLPPEIKALIKSASENNEDTGVASIDPITGECKILNLDEDLSEHERSMVIEAKKQAEDLMEFDAQEKELSTHQAPKSIS